MKKIVYMFLFLLMLFSISFAQSGRLDSLRVRTEYLWGIDNDAKFDSTDYNQAINMACEVLPVDIIKRDTIALAPNVRDYSLNADCKEIILARYLRDSEFIPDTLSLQKVDITDLGKKYESKLNVPTQYAQVNKTMSVYRIPMQVESLLVYYLATPNSLDSNSDTTIIAVEDRPLIPLFAKMWMKVRTGEMTEIQVIEFLLGIRQKQKKVDIVAQPEVIK